MKGILALTTYLIWQNGDSRCRDIECRSRIKEGVWSEKFGFAKLCRINECHVNEVRLYPAAYICVVRCGSKNGYQNGIGLKDIGLLAGNIGIHPMLNKHHRWGNLYDHLLNMRIFSALVNKMFNWAPKLMREVATTSIWMSTIMN